MLGGPILVTKRLILRPPGPEDFEAHAAFCADEHTMRFLGGVKGRAESWRILCNLAGAWHIRGFSMFSLIERSSGQWIGRAGPWQPEGWPGQEVGWGILPQYAGQGLAQEAAVAAMDYAFDVLGWDRVIHTINPENLASIRLAERLGSVNEGPTQMPPPFENARVDCYAQSKADWGKNRSAG